MRDDSQQHVRTTVQNMLSSTLSLWYRLHHSRSSYANYPGLYLLSIDSIKNFEFLDFPFLKSLPRKLVVLNIESKNIFILSSPAAHVFECTYVYKHVETLGEPQELLFRYICLSFRIMSFLGLV